MLFIRKFELDVSIQPSGEPREFHQGEVRQTMSKSKFSIDLMSLFNNQIFRSLTVGVEYHSKFKKLREGVKKKLNFLANMSAIRGGSTPPLIADMPRLFF